MKLRTFKSKKDNLYYFEIKSKKLGKNFLKNPQGFETKINRNDFLISVLHSLSDKKLSTLKGSKNKKSYLIIKNKFGKTLLKSKSFNKEEITSILKELKKSEKSLINKAYQKPHSDTLNLYPETQKEKADNHKKAILKKDQKSKSEKTYLSNGKYHFNDIYYDIFLSGNGRHYFSFVNNNGKTVLLNGEIKGFKSIEEAEDKVKEVLLFAPSRKNFEIKTAKDGKFFFHLFNSKKEKIAKSFFFRKKEELEASIEEFLGEATPAMDTKKPVETIEQPTQIKEQPIAAAIVPPVDVSNKNDLAEKEENRKRAAEERRKTAERERLALENKRKKEAQAENEKRDLEKRESQKKEKERIERERKEKQRKEKEIALSAEKKEIQAKKEKRDSYVKKAAAAPIQTQGSNSHDDKDFLDGCFKWFGLLLLLGLFVLALSYYKGCFQDVDKNGTADMSSMGDSTNVDGTTTNDSLLVGNDGSQALDENKSGNGNGMEGNGGNDDDENSSNGANNGNKNSDSSSAGNASDGGSQSGSSSSQKIPSCNCADKAIVFEIPQTEAKSVNRLGTNPQFGDTHGLSSSDFYEELKHASEANSWDKSYLNYLYKAMGYTNGFADAKASHFSQSTITPGVKGILGFGKYSGYGYSKLDLKGKDLEVFRVEAANGCHISFMKTCGNLLFICE